MFEHKTAEAKLAKDQPPAVFVLQRSPSPYRVSLFNRLSEAVPLVVVYGRVRDPSRQWDSILDKAQFPWMVAPGFDVRLSRREFSFRLFPSSVPKSAIAAIVVETDLSTLLTNRSALLRARAQRIPRGCIVSMYRAAGKSRLPALRRFFDLVGLQLVAPLIKRSRSHLVYSRAAEREVLLRYGRKAVPFYSAQWYPLSESVEAADVNPQKTLKIGVLAYLSPRKDVETAFLAVSSTDTPVTLHVAGTGDPRYQKRLKRLAPSDTVWHGYLAGNAKERYLASLDALVMTSHKDSWGHVVMEALNQGTPVLGSERANAVLDVIEDGVNGFRFSSGEELQQILNRTDRSDLRRMRAAARASAVRFMDHAIHACEEFFLSLSGASE